MFHPFGRSTTEGKPKLGCYETDALAGAEVIFKDGTVDLETTKLLNNHRAHYEFPEICQRFYKNGSVVGLRMPGGGLNTARVSHHYSQLGIDTTDGVSVRGINNLYAIGDSEGWTLSNYGLRLPGFGIAKSLNDAELVSKRHNSTEYIPRNLARENITTEIIGNGRLEDNEKLSKIIRTINTDSLLDLNFSDRPKREICDDWYDKLADLGASESAVWEISLGVARIHRLRTEGNIREPFSLTKDFVRSFDYELKGANELPYLNNNVEHSTRAGWRR
jgi:hypothetical protein